MVMRPIETGVPLPLASVRGPAIPWRTLRVGESVFVPASDLAARSRNWAWSLVCAANLRHTDSRFEVRRVDGGVRFWRTA